MHSFLIVKTGFKSIPIFNHQFGLVCYHHVPALKARNLPDKFLNISCWFRQNLESFLLVHQQAPLKLTLLEICLVKFFRQRRVAVLVSTLCHDFVLIQSFDFFCFVNFDF